jgi:hypothetical protein
MDSRRAEEDHGVLNVFGLEPPKGFEIFGEYTQGSCLLTFEELLASVGERLRMHE